MDTQDINKKNYTEHMRSTNDIVQACLIHLLEDMRSKYDCSWFGDIERHDINVKSNEHKILKNKSVSDFRFDTYFDLSACLKYVQYMYRYRNNNYEYISPKTRIAFRKAKCKKEKNLNSLFCTYMKFEHGDVSNFLMALNAVRNQRNYSSHVSEKNVIKNIHEFNEGVNRNLAFLDVLRNNKIVEEYYNQLLDYQQKVNCEYVDVEQKRVKIFRNKCLQAMNTDNYGEVQLMLEDISEEYLNVETKIWNTYVLEMLEAYKNNKEDVAKSAIDIEELRRIKRKYYTYSEENYKFREYQEDFENELNNNYVKYHSENEALDTARKSNYKILIKQLLYSVGSVIFLMLLIKIMGNGLYLLGMSKKLHWIWKMIDVIEPIICGVVIIIIAGYEFINIKKGIKNNKMIEGKRNSTDKIDEIILNLDVENAIVVQH